MFSQELFDVLLYTQSAGLLLGRNSQDAELGGCLSMKELVTTRCARRGGKGHEGQDSGTVLGILCQRTKFDLANPIQTKAAFSFAMTVMDKVGGWSLGIEKGRQIGATFTELFGDLRESGYLKRPKAHGNIQNQRKVNHGNHQLHLCDNSVPP